MKSPIQSDSLIPRPLDEDAYDCDVDKIDAIWCHLLSHLVIHILISCGFVLMVETSIDVLKNSLLVILQ